MEYEALMAAAIEARKMSYSPYSGYRVGAALLCEDGQVIIGCNIENGSYGATNCAERTAFFKAISEGHTSFRAIAIAGGPAGKAGEDVGAELESCYPCGICRQVMAEFCDAESFEIICGLLPEKLEVYKLKDLLPKRFSGKDYRL